MSKGGQNSRDVTTFLPTPDFFLRSVKGAAMGVAGWGRYGWLIAGILLVTSSVAGQDNPKALVSKVVDNELHSEHAPHYWMYLDSNVKHGKTEVDRVLETKECWFRWPVSVNGHPASAQDREQAEQQLRQLADDPSFRQRNRKEIDEDSSKADSLLKILPDAFLFTAAGHTGNAIVLHFRPNPNYNPPSREAKVFHAMAGELVIDARETRLEKLTGKLTQDVDFGLGILGKIHKGGTFAVVQSEVAPGDWELTKLDVDITGRALFFHTISEQQHERMTRFEPVPSNIGLKQAAEIVQKPGHEPKSLASAKTQ